MTPLPHDRMTITVDALRFYARHGVGAQERAVGNDFEVSVEIEIPPVYTDELTDTVSYADIVDIVKTEMAQPSKLIEHVAARIRDALLRRFPTIRSGRVRVAKLTPPIPGAQMASAAVTLAW